MKLPNGYGSIYKLSGHRRKPYAVTKTSYKDGKRKTEYLGYFETKPLAIKFLADYNLLPQERQNSMTFEELYNEWSEYKYPTLSQSAMKSYVTAYNRCLGIQKSKLSDITQSALQSLIDNERTISTKRRNYYFFRAIYDYAEKRDYIERNRTPYLDVPSQEKSEMHRRLTDAELSVLWANKNNPTVATFLCMIYTGCRPMELFLSQKYDDYIEVKKGKTKNAVRQVPLHKDIIKLAKLIPPIYDYQDYNLWYKTHFTNTMKTLGIDCTPYDARHTFATLWSEQGLSEYMRCKIQGHSTKNMGQDYYVHYDLSVLRDEINKLHTHYSQKLQKQRTYVP